MKKNKKRKSEDCLNSDKIPTMEELQELFKSNDFTTSAVYGEDELTNEEEAEIAYISNFFNSEWDKLAKDKGLKGHISCYSKDNPLIALRNSSAKVVSENVYKLIDEHPEQAAKILEQFSDYFDHPEKADELLQNGIDTAMDVMKFSELAEVIQSEPAEEDFSYKQRNFPRMDFERKWYHTRAKATVESVQDIDEESQYADDVEDIVFSNMRFDAFWNSLSEEDKIILTHSMNGLTQNEIAEKWDMLTIVQSARSLRK